MEKDWIIGRKAFKSALDVVSKVRLEQTIYAEYPEIKSFIQKLQREKTEQRINTLAKIWEVNEKEASEIAKKLSEIGFFEERGSNTDRRYWIPFIYRNELNLIQGTAE